MGVTGGLIAIGGAIALVWLLKAKDGVQKPFTRNWMALIAVTMAVMTLFVGGAAAIIANWGS